MHVWMFCEIIDTPIASEWFAVRMHTITSHTFSFDVNHKHSHSLSRWNSIFDSNHIDSRPICLLLRIMSQAEAEHVPSHLFGFCIWRKPSAQLGTSALPCYLSGSVLIPYHPTYVPTITLTSLSLWACQIFSLDYTPLENVAFSSDDSIIRIAYQLWMSRTIKIHYMTSKFGRKYWRNERFFGASKIRWKIHLKCVLE